MTVSMPLDRRTVRLGAVSIEPVRGDKDANLATAMRLVKECAARGAEA